MKKLVIILGVILVIILSVALIVPIIFKDDIKAAIDKSLAESVNADIVWNTEDFGISLFTNFPNATAELNNFGVINRAPFEGEILFAVEAFEVEIDLFSLFGDQIKVSGIQLVHPEINIKVLEDGTANYDIAITSDEVAVQDTVSSEATAFNVGIDHWSITRGHVIYDDATLPFLLEVKNLNHNGSGDFNQDEFDVATNTSIDSLSVIFDGIEYISDKQLSSDITLSISDNYSKYTFKENAINLNDFGFGFDGWLSLNADGSMGMDLTYGAKETTFKSLLSLVPGVYTNDFSSIETTGVLAFDGMVKGTFDSLNMPAFKLNMKVDDAMFKYPDLPTAISNISMDLLVDNNDGIIDNTVVDLKQFHMDFGNNPIDARARIANLVDYNMDAKISGKLNLAELSDMFPIEGTNMKGLFSIDLEAAGVYDSITGKTPTVDAVMLMQDGYIKTADMPYALEGLAFDAEIKSPTGLMEDFKAFVKDFNMTMDGEPFKADLVFSNLNNYTWDLSASGGMDLEKITKVFPLEGMTLAGIVKADLSTAGNMSDLEAERYAQLPTSGQVSIANFKYTDADLPYDVTISSAKAAFDPEKIALNDYKGTVGKSDMAMTGAISNYIGYLFGENQTLKGSLNFSSNLLDLNEFMTEEETASGQETTETPTTDDSYGIVEVPTDIDFILSSAIKTVAVMDMQMTNAKGDIIVRDGVVNLSGLKFNLLEGQFAINGTYDPRDTQKPKYDFDLKVDELSAQKAFQTFSIVKSYFPIANKVDGKLSTDFKLNGLLTQEMLPDMKTVTGAGLLNIAQAQLENSETLQKIGSLTSLNSLSNTDKVDIKDILMDVTIEDGKVNVKPFDLELAGYKTSISGSSYLDGSLDYSMKMNVPAGKLGSSVNSLVAKYTGGNSDGNTIIPLSIGVGGTYDDPKLKLNASEQRAQVKDVAKAVVKDQIEEKTGVDLDAEKEKQRQSIIAEAQDQADKIVAQGKQAADKLRKEGYAQADNIVKEAGSNFLKKKIAEEAAKKLKRETDQKANKVEAESKSKADAIMAKAREKAAAI